MTGEIEFVVFAVEEAGDIAALDQGSPVAPRASRRMPGAWHTIATGFSAATVSSIMRSTRESLARSHNRP